MRTAVVLKHVVGLSYDEISDSLDRPPGTVRSDVSRGLARLRSALHREEER
jgi:RNA polymerase sigma-70 factor (ECF subfamily)